ncbi:MAG: peptidylprolyl isomerase, partial [Planctomycetota bacterium]
MIAAGLLFCVFSMATNRSVANAQQDDAMNSAGAADLKAAFQSAYEAYRQEVIAIEALRSEYQTADGARREAINAELRTRHPQSTAILGRMVDAAVAAYNAAPEGDPQITQLLQAVAAHRIAGSGPNSQGGDDYEGALQVINALIDGGSDMKELPLWGLLAAFATNDLDRAEQFRALAQENGVLADPPDADSKTASEVYALASGMADSLEQQRALWEKEREIRAAEAAADDLPRVRLTTSEGELIVELFENEAPQATASFISLVKDGFYDGII